MDLLIEQRLGKRTQSVLDAKTRKCLSAVEHAIVTLQGAALVSHLFVLFSRYKTRCPEAAAVVLDELYVQHLNAGVGSELSNEIKHGLVQVSRWCVRKKTLDEFKIWIACAKVQILGVEPRLARRELGDLIKQTNWSNYSAYTLAIMGALFDGTRRTVLLDEALKRIDELDANGRLKLFYAVFGNGLAKLKQSRNYDQWQDIRMSISAQSLSSVSTATLIGLARIRRDESASMSDLMLIGHLCKAADRRQYRFVEALAASAYPISRDSDLQTLVRSELQEWMPRYQEIPALLAEFAKFGVVPMSFIASRIKPCMDSSTKLSLVERLQLLTAFSRLGNVDPQFARTVYLELNGSLATYAIWLALFISDALYSFAICDALTKSRFASELLPRCWTLLEACYEELNDRERMQIGRVALFIQGKNGNQNEPLGRNLLPKNLRNSLRRIVYQIKNNPPRANQVECDFVKQLQDAMPEAVVTAGGFTATHHLDATVELNGQLYDAELDGRVHDVHTLYGAKIGQRGEDALRDFNVASSGYKVVRFTRDEFEQANCAELIRQRFGLDS